MYYIYVISSESKKYIYVGLTNDVSRRLEEYNKGFNKITKPYRPFKLILTENFKSRSEARVREKYLKNGLGKELLKSLIR